MFANISEFEEEEEAMYSSTPMNEIITPNYEPSSFPDRNFLANLIQYRYQTPLDGSGIRLTNVDTIRRMAADITAAVANSDPNFNEHLRQVYLILENSLVDLKRLELNLQKARIFRAEPTLRQRILTALGNSENIIPFINMVLNIMIIVLLAATLFNLTITKTKSTTKFFSN